MNYIYLLVTLISTSSYVILTYKYNTIDPILYYGLGIFFAVLGNVTWLICSKTFIYDEDMFKFAGIWDTAIVICWIVIPLLFCNIDISTQKITGILFMLLGVTMINIS